MIEWPRMAWRQPWLHEPGSENQTFKCMKAGNGEGPCGGLVLPFKFMAVAEDPGAFNEEDHSDKPGSPLARGWPDGKAVAQIKPRVPRLLAAFSKIARQRAKRVGLFFWGWPCCVSLLLLPVGVGSLGSLWGSNKVELLQLFLTKSTVLGCWMISEWMLVFSSSFDCLRLNFILLAMMREVFFPLWTLRCQNFFWFDFSHYGSIYIEELMMNDWIIGILGGSFFWWLNDWKSAWWSSKNCQKSRTTGRCAIDRIMAWLAGDCSLLDVGYPCICFGPSKFHNKATYLMRCCCWWAWVRSFARRSEPAPTGAWPSIALPDFRGQSASTNISNVLLYLYWLAC